MIRLEDIRAALVDGNTAVKGVGAARDFGSVNANSINWPYAWVIPAAETSGPNRYQYEDLVDQRVISRFSVIYAVRDISDKTGAQAVSELEAVRTASINVLGAFVPPNAETSCIHANGRLVSSIGKDGRLFWQDDFNVEFSRRIPNPSNQL